MDCSIKWKISTICSLYILCLIRDEVTYRDTAFQIFECVTSVFWGLQAKATHFKKGKFVLCVLL